VEPSTAATIKRENCEQQVGGAGIEAKSWSVALGSLAGG
jgi:hypothetical protein